MTDTFNDLQHNDHRVRLAEVHRARRLLANDPGKLWTVLSPSLTDAYPAVRAECALIFGDLVKTHPPMLALLAESVGKGEASGRQAALLGLGRAGLAAASFDGSGWDLARDAALKAVGSEDADVRFQALTALSRLGAQGEPVVKAARGRLEDKDPEVGGVAAELLASLGDADSAQAIWSRADAVRKKHRRPFLMALATLLADYPDAPGLGDIHDRFLRWLVAEAKTFPTGIRACEVLGRLGDKAAIEPLKAMAGGWTTNRFLKVAAAAALVRLGDTSGTEALGRFMSARKQDMRGFAIEQIGALALADYTDALIAIAKDARDYHADTAVIALGGLDDPRALDAVLAATHDSRPEVRLEAVRALHTRGAAPDRLADLARDDPDDDVRAAALGDAPPIPEEDP